MPQACNSLSTQKLAESLNPPYKVNKYDLKIEYYVKDPETLLAVLANPEL